MNIVERIKSFDAKNPDWHLIDVLRNVSFANMIGVVDTIVLNNTKHFIDVNICARDIVHKNSYAEGKKVQPDEFVIKSRELTLINL